MNNKFQKGLVRKFLEHCTDYIRKPKHQLGETRIKVERAPEPSDVLWENLSYRTSKKFVRRIFTRLATFFVVICGFVIIILVYWGQVKQLFIIQYNADKRKKQWNDLVRNQIQFKLFQSWLL